MFGGCLWRGYPKFAVNERAWIEMAEKVISVNNVPWLVTAPL
jgi:hypothetical protein